MSKSGIVIGAGIAGLSAGCYCAMNGFDVQIFEMYNIPGGLRTAWRKKGYTFDLSVDWLVGSSPQSSLHLAEPLLVIQQEPPFFQFQSHERASS